MTLGGSCFVGILCRQAAGVVWTTMASTLRAPYCPPRPRGDARTNHNAVVRLSGSKFMLGSRQTNATNLFGNRLVWSGRRERELGVPAETAPGSIRRPTHEQIKITQRRNKAVPRAADRHSMTGGCRRFEWKALHAASAQRQAVVALWNRYARRRQRKKVGDRDADRSAWAAMKMLRTGAQATRGPPPKQDVVIAMLRQPECKRSTRWRA